LTDPDAEYAPSRLFYYPVSLKIPSASFQVLGNLLDVTLPSVETARKPAEKAKPPDTTLRLPGAIRPAGEHPEAEQPPGEEPERPPPATLRPPAVQTSVPVSIQKTPLQFILSYQVRPTMNVEQSFNWDDWDRPQEVTYDLDFTTLDTRSTTSLDHSLRILENVLLWNGNIALTGNYRSRYRQSFPLGPDWDSKVLADQQYSQINAKTTQGLDYYPLADNPIFSRTSLNYDLSWIFFRYLRDPASPVADPLYYVPPPEWTRDTVTVHNAQAALRWRMFEADNSLSLSAQLPPRQGSFTGNLQFKIWLLTTTVNSVFQDTTGSTNPWDDWSDWSFQPLVVRETLDLGENVNISEELRFDLQESVGRGLLVKSITSVNLWDFSGSYTKDYMKPQVFNDSSGNWEDGPGEASLLPSYVDLSYDVTGRERLFWKNRIRLNTSINTSWSMNIQQPTDNSLDFSLGIVFWLYKFLRLSLTVSSYNDHTFRYFPKLADKLGEPSVNLFEDLFKSFNFFDRETREQSAFNLRGVSVEATHYLHDWNLTLTYEGKPTLNQKAVPNPQYEWESTFSIVLQWLPIPELRSNIRGERDVEKDEFEFSLRG
jgi:hypothetical protein